MGTGRTTRKKGKVKCITMKEDFILGTGRMTRNMDKANRLKMGKVTMVNGRMDLKRAKENSVVKMVQSIFILIIKEILLAKKKLLRKTCNR